MRLGLFIFLLLIGSNVMAAKTPLIVGVWKSLRADNQDAFIVRPDGTAFRVAAKLEGTWQAADKKSVREFTIQWPDGKNYVQIDQNNQILTAVADSGYKLRMARDSYPPIEIVTATAADEPEYDFKSNKAKAAVQKHQDASRKSNKRNLDSLIRSLEAAFKHERTEGDFDEAIKIRTLSRHSRRGPIQREPQWQVPKARRRARLGFQKML